MAVTWGIAACADDGEQTSETSSAPCPVQPVDVVVSVDQWGDIVSDLGGACANVTTVLAASAADPHDFEPAPADAAKFEGAQLVVLNGGHYDEWAAKLAASAAPEAPVVAALAVSGGDGGAHAHDGETNPHAWYDPAAVTTLADAVTARLRQLAPDAAGYFDERRVALPHQLVHPAQHVGGALPRVGRQRADQLAHVEG